MNGKDKAKAFSRLNEILERAKNVRALSTNSPDFKKWQRDARVAISHTFGQNSSHVAEFNAIRFTPRPRIKGRNSDWNGAYGHGMQSAEAMLKSMVDEIEEYWEDTPPAKPIGKITSSRKVFVIHGHDETAQLAVARFLERLDLDAVILAEQASGGQTIIEKVEAHADVGYAVALLTADDVGSRQGEDAVQPRARQNVIFELGYFIGCLGRERVCALTKGQPEIPSDYSGVMYIPMISSEWKMTLFKELKAAGFDLDANKVFG